MHIQDILDLSIAERISIIEKIWDSIDPSGSPLSAAHEQELDRRITRYEKGGTTFFSWNAVKKELNAAKS